MRHVRHKVDDVIALLHATEWNDARGRVVNQPTEICVPDQSHIPGKKQKKETWQGTRDEKTRGISDRSPCCQIKSRRSKEVPVILSHSSERLKIFASRRLVLVFTKNQALNHPIRSPTRYLTRYIKPATENVWNIQVVLSQCLSRGYSLSHQWQPNKHSSED